MQENITEGYPKRLRNCKEHKNMYAEDGPVTTKITNRHDNITSHAGNHHNIFDMFSQLREVSNNSLEERPQAQMSATRYCQFKWLGFIYLF